jgi:CheY-like chemotaxis protein
MRKTFMLADDDMDDIELFSHALSEVDTSITCYTALSGTQALRKLEDPLTPKPDIIFLDINMPEMNGWKCLQALKQHEAHKDIPVIMYSTSSEKVEIERAKKFGALCYYIKPGSYPELINMLSIVKKHVETNAFDTLCEAIHRKSA